MKGQTGAIAEIRTDMATLNSASKIARPTDVYQKFGEPESIGKPETSGDGDVVVVRDSGIDESHPMFDGIKVEKPNIDGLPTDGADKVGHGTAVAGALLLGASKIERLVSVPIFGDSGRTDLGTIQRSYNWLNNRKKEFDKVIDSWGSSRKVPQIDQPHNRLEQGGVECWVASGNTDGQTGSPATAQRAYSIAAVRLNGQMARFSSPTDDLSMVGVDVAVPLSSDSEVITGPKIPKGKYDSVMSNIGGEWAKLAGTSFANPYAAGYGNSWQMMESVEDVEGSKPDHDTDVEVVFLRTAKDVQGTGEDGKGYIDLDAALDYSSNGKTVNATVIDLFGNDIISLEGEVLQGGQYVAETQTLKEAMEKR